MRLVLQIGESGKSSRELEKTIALLKKVVERTQQENEQLKRSPGVSNEQVKLLQTENQALKVRTAFAFESCTGAFLSGQGSHLVRKPENLRPFPATNCRQISER